MSSDLVVTTCPSRSGARLSFPRLGVVAALLIAVATGCLSEPSGPFGHHLTLTPQGLSFGALGDTARLSALELGPGATPLPTPTVAYWSPSPTVATVDSSGLVTSRGNGATWIVARAPSGEIDSVPVTVVQLPSRVVAAGDTLRFEALGAVQSLETKVVDRLGAAIPGLSLEYWVEDTSVATVSAQGQVVARRNGVTLVRVSGAGDSARVIIQVQQRPVRVVTRSDSLHFVALGETGSVVGIAVDSLGHPVPEGGVTDLTVEDTSVLEVVDAVTVRARRNGRTVVRFSAAGLPAQQVGVVSQTPDTIVVAVADTHHILSIVQDSVIPVSCRVLDRNGYPVDVEPAVAASAGGRWSGSTCQTLRLRSSGFDTLRIAWGDLSTSLPVVLTVRPIIGPAVPVIADSLPANTSPWAPSARRSALGEVELYFAGYASVVDSTGHQPANLYRLISNDGLTFRYDGVVLTHDPDYCDLNGSGIENIDIVPRADGPGWRMFFAGGSFDCYGWQVFSAVSTDGRTWSKETGVRVSNGGPLPPNPPGAARWPAGEGMVTDQLPDGSWRMTVGTYEPLTPSEDKFQITEWRSPDQLSWTYVRSLVTTRQLPPEGQRSAYSPTLSEVVPGLWRMFFTADNLNQSGGRSRLWSAVSTDRINWSVEGEILGAPGVNYLYSALVGDRLFTLQAPQGPLVNTTKLVSVTVKMP